MKGASGKAALIAFSFIVLCAFALAATRLPWRSDAAFKSLFFRHRGDFQTLVEMANEDVHLIRIAPNYTWLDDDVSWPRKNVGISEERWADYKRLFQRVGTDGIVKPTDPPARIIFPIVSAGIVPGGYKKGLVYCPAPLTPVLGSLNERPPDQYWDNRGHVLVYKQIAVNWYIFYEQW